MQFCVRMQMLSVPAFIRLAIVQQSAALERDWGIGKKQQLLHSFAACVFCLSNQIRKRLFIHKEIYPLLLTIYEKSIIKKVCYWIHSLLFT